MHPASAKQTIVFATQGLGAEGTATQAAVKAFEKSHHNITVKILTLSPTSDVAYQQLTQRFTAGSSTPDVITSDVIWPTTFARPGWLANLQKFHPDTSAFFPGQMATGKYKGGIYAIPWFINAEGLYYRTDLIKTPPTTAAQVFSEAKAAMKKDPKLKEGLAFEGDKYEEEAKKRHLTYVALDGEIGIIGNGAGLCMGTLDLVQRAGSAAANFCDIGGAAKAEVVENALHVILMNPRVKGVLVNIFGGIAKCDLIAEALVKAGREVGFKVPVVVRLEGTNVERAREILAAARTELPMMQPATDLTDAAKKVVAAAGGK